ncbi:serine threonine kinase [Fusarium heterosporum]|uniref:Serine threonine kinase n=1 Tax=Fusarium heterosporum TaxID=42747 RepID=A0A8H5TGV5_FUSHE|nr:serine threonine kinase [Fusarium heterosporum]
MVQLVAVALYHRNHFSLGNARQAFGYEAYHWSIMVMPEPSEGDTPTCHIFDATDTSAINPETFRMNNPTMDWWFRSQIDTNPYLNMKLLGRVVFGRIPDEISSVKLDEFFRNIPLPVKNTYPQQSSVSWAVDAICAIQRQGWAPEFDLRNFKDFALAYGDVRMKGSESGESDITYFVEEEEEEEEDVHVDEEG